MRRLLIAAPLAAVAILLSTGCSGGSGDADGDLPAGEQLLASAADEMAELETVAMRMEADTALADLPVYQVDGVITRAGEAEGTAQLEQLGQRVELQFVVVEETFHYQLIGAWAQMPLSDAATLYDPSAILDPDRGLANLLRTASDPEVRGRDGDQYEVAATFEAAALGVLLPGVVTEDVRGTVWIGVDRPLLHRAEFPVPAENEQAGTLTVALSEFDQPVTISAP